jgi:hypothetical protein
VFTTADAFNVDVEVAHFGPKPIERPGAEWKVIDAAEKSWSMEVGPSSRYRSERTFNSVKSNWIYQSYLHPRSTSLWFELARTLRTIGIFGSIQNRQQQTVNSGVLLTSSWDEAQQKLAKGGKVLFTPRTNDLDWTSPPLDNVPVFWNRLMGPAWSRMLGLLVNTKHPSLASFPSDPNFDWQWAEIIRNVRAVNMDGLPHELEPIVWAIDDWNRNYKLGVVFECKVGTGRLMVSSFDLDEKSMTNPVARQLKNSLLSYINSARFQPRVAVKQYQLENLFFPTRIMNQLRVVATAESLAPNAAPTLSTVIPIPTGSLGTNVESGSSVT